jgi:hypothetical protein
MRYNNLEFRYIVFAFLAYISHKVTDGDILFGLASIIFFILYIIIVIINIIIKDEEEK